MINVWKKSRNVWENIMSSLKLKMQSESVFKSLVKESRKENFLFPFTISFIYYNFSYIIKINIINNF